MKGNLKDKKLIPEYKICLTSPQLWSPLASLARLASLALRRCEWPAPARSLTRAVRRAFCLSFRGVGLLAWIVFCFVFLFFLEGSVVWVGFEGKLNRRIINY